MFTYIKLKNFMSFKDVFFDFRNGKKGIKNFISIYGENGSGKSNFVTSIDLLRRSIDSFGMLSDEDKFKDMVKKGDIPEDIVNFLFREFNVLNQMKNCRMLEEEEDTALEYGFKYNGHEGYYRLDFNERIVHEELYYFSGKQRGKIFEIKHCDEEIKVSFSNKLFLDKKIADDMRNEIEKFWGKHTFLSILKKEEEEKNEAYIKKNYLSYVFDILDMLQEITLYRKKSSRSGVGIHSDKERKLLQKLDEGQINKKYVSLLTHSETILREFFTQIYADIKDVFYKRKENDDKIDYKLCVKKMIGGKIRTIDFSCESSGTQHILEVISALLGVFYGLTVIYDEIDNGIHDLLLKCILSSMIDDINGQLIFTTHNTYLLEEISTKSVYVITSDYQGNKEVKCLDQYPRIQGNNNPRVMYLKGMFGGIPIIDLVDYDEIIENLNAFEYTRGGE